MAAALAVVLGCVWLRSRVRACESDARLHQVARMLALALLLGLLARALGRVLIEVPSALWALPIAGAGVLLGRDGRAPRAGLVLLLALGAGLLGAWFESRGPQAHGLVHSGPILGVHPRQVVAVRIDGFGPHDVVVDDYVDPPGGLGYDPQAWATWLELELHAIAQTHYADGPARAHEAFANAEVRVIDAELEADPSQLRVEVRSGTSGEGSKVEFVCPGRTLGAAAAPEPSRACPSKYVVDGSTGLGLSSRFPGDAQVRGRDRARLARSLGWPHAQARRDRRSLALESGAWLLLLVVGSFLASRRGSNAKRAALDMRGSWLAGLAAIGLAGIALIGPHAPLDASVGGPTLLALAIVVLAPAAVGTAGRELVLPVAGLIVLLAASPLAGSGDVLALLDSCVERLVLGLGLDWQTSRALAGSLCVVVLAAGLGVGAPMLFGSREGQHGTDLGSDPRPDPEPSVPRAAIPFALALVVAVALALRKPVDDLALLQGAAALLLASTLQFRSGPSRLAFALALVLACSLGPALVLARDGAIAPVALGSAILASLGCLALVWSR